MSDTLIGVSRPRIDAPDKVTGATRFAADGYVHGLLHARPVLATEAHARIRGIDKEAALAIPGVVAVLAAADLPIASTGTDRTSEPLAREEVVFAGQPVALVVAESEAAAEDGAEAVVIDYESLAAAVDVEEAMQPGAALARTVEESDDEGGDLESIHAGVDHGQADDPEEELSGNVLDRITREQGDVGAAFAASAAVVEGTFRTPWVYQAYLEPQVCTAWLEPSGTLVVSTSTQGAFVTQRELARAFDLPLERVRVIAEPLGGAFGGKFALVEPLAVGAALALRRPVRLVLTRSEDFQATNPASAQVTRLKIGARADGTLTGIEARHDRRPRLERRLGRRGHQLAARRRPVQLGGARPARLRRADEPLHVRCLSRAGRADRRLRARVAPRRARRRRSGSIRSSCGCKNAVVEGDVGVSGNPYPDSSARGEVLERLKEHPLWSRRATRSRRTKGSGWRPGHWPGGLEPAAAVCRVDSDGTMTVVTSAADMSGVNSGFAIIAAAAFGLSPDKVRVVCADTSSGPYAGGSGGSKVTYTVGAAVLRAAESARQKVLAAASQELEIAPDDLEVIDGVVSAVGAPDRSITVEELAKKALRFGGQLRADRRPRRLGADERRTVRRGPPLARSRRSRDGRGRAPPTTSSRRTSAARSTPPSSRDRCAAVPTQGMGWAIFEQLDHDEDGRLLTGSFLDYAIPTAERVPEIETLIVEVPAPDGPFGAKGIGEASVVGAPAAVANAVAAATGTRLHELPMTPPRVWEALRS